MQFTVGIVCNRCLPFDGKTVLSKPLGGTESAVYYLAEEMAKLGVGVTVFTEQVNPESSLARYRNLGEFENNDNFHVLISVRDWMPLMMFGHRSLRLWWSGDAADQPATYGIGDRRVVNRLHSFLSVSAWQASTMAGHSGYPIDKIQRLPNGINGDFFIEEGSRVRKRLIYSSTPYRGLDFTPEIFEQVLKAHPDAEFHIYSGFEVYGNNAPPAVAAKFEETRKRLTQNKNVKIFGNVPQAELAKAFLSSAVLFYPNTFPETSCITALEAQAGGCVVVSSELGALPETVGSDGFLIKGRPGTPEYNSHFVEAVNKLLSDDELFNRLSSQGRKKVLEQFTWKNIAKVFVDQLGRTLSQFK